MRNWILLILVISLGAFLYFQPKDEGFSISTIDPASVSKIEISKKGAPPVLLTKQDGKWKIVSPVRQDANPQKVNDLLSVLKARSDQRLDPGDLSRF